MISIKFNQTIQLFIHQKIYISKFEIKYYNSHLFLLVEGWTRLSKISHFQQLIRLKLSLIE